VSAAAGIEIRVAGWRERDDLLDLLETFVREVLPEKDSRAVRAAYARHLATRRAARTMRSLVLYRAGRPIGCAQLFHYPHPPMLDTDAFREAEVMNVYVVEPERRGGCGRMLMDRLIAEARGLGVRNLRLNSSPVAERLYESCGFKAPPFKDYTLWLEPG
jgi:GNAT superfamily N-acetyltransferase